MKILLDECITQRLLTHLSDFETTTVSKMGWSGVKNGKLMSLCVEHNFDILLTIDKNLIFQQNLDKYPISIVVLKAKNSKLEEILKIIPNFILVVKILEKHKAYEID